MTNTQLSELYFFPNKMGRIVLLAYEEVLTRSGLTAITRLAGLDHLVNNFPPNNMDSGMQFEDISKIHHALDAIYGPRAGQGIALRAGQACFKYGLREFGPMMGVSDLSFRLLPLPLKIKNGLTAFANTFNHHSDQIVRLEEYEQGFRWIIERCPLCWQRETHSAGCHLAVGLMQEALYWVSNGKNFEVIETACIAQGDQTCTLEISRKPLD
jgi:predicted hydrocarbon binding protein